jgi:hypothetical protein
MDKLKEIIKAKIKEMSATGTGGASFSAGEGEGYATPAAFASKTNSKGTKNIYYYKLGFKPAPTPHPKSFEIKKLWEADVEMSDVKKFQEARINEFDQIQDELNKLISNAKNQTVEYYQANPGQFSIYKPTSMALEYIKKAKELLSK